MATTANTGDTAQLSQTIEMFEVITQSQPQDYQSLEILKEAYSKVGREEDVIRTSKRIAEAYVHMGQYSSAILEYETILQRHPDDQEVREALGRIESQAGGGAENLDQEPAAIAIKEQSSGKAEQGPAKTTATPASDIDDGRKAMHKIFVDSKIISASDFDLCWHTPDPTTTNNGITEPFIQLLADKAILPIDRSLKLLSDRSRVAYVPLEKYDLDIDLARGFPAQICLRWCVLPIDRMSKSIMVATANPFNQQAAKELSQVSGTRLLWYLVPPTELVKHLRKAFR